ncbi:hypothetical protein [Neptuniibacter sp. CAU 1671]|uniref:hypothetical protein n=1 Tax=Neptuniibacter sp. CAU 1671 TaxID=3032593 RepID=UPI0023DC2F02|nr:hypothetical protein [Neptuniibacter sp. CAU 1671]MDF2182921.1 hypothetical protein [Neptuniibacter sp. CAU 1671]
MTDKQPEMVLEIVELENGELAIRSAELDAEPMIKIEFSETLRDQLEEQYLDVARVMLTAGIQLAVENGVNLKSRPANDEMLHILH